MSDTARSHVSGRFINKYSREKSLNVNDLDTKVRIRATNKTQKTQKEEIKIRNYW